MTSAGQRAMTEDDRMAARALRQAAALISLATAAIEKSAGFANDASHVGLKEIERDRFHLAAIAQAEYLRRSLREKLSFAPMLSDPAWDIMLDMFISWAKGRTTMVSDAQYAARAPSTTALRYVHALEQSGHIIKRPSDNDARVVLISLADKGIVEMGNYLVQIDRSIG
jgi:DNA-binding MarR family transcriptional regulator